MPDLILNSPIVYEPHKKNRWTIDFPTDIGIQNFMLKSADSPKMNINKVEMEFLNTSTFVAGRYVWQEMTIVIRDFIAPSTRQALMEWVRLTAESTTGRMGYAVGYSKNLLLKTLDPTGVTASQWILENCIIVGDVDFGGSLDYSEDGVVELTFTVQPQKCILTF
jgi:hypothetical protein